MNHLEQLVGEWLQYKGYFVRLSVPVGKRDRGGYSGELDVVGYNFRSGHLLHVECSLDSNSMERREQRFALKLQRGREFIAEVFPGMDLPETVDQKIVLQYPNTSIREIAGAPVIPVRELIHEILEGLKGTTPSSGAVPSTWPLLRTIQLTADAFCSGAVGQRIVPITAPDGTLDTAEIVAVPCVTQSGYYVFVARPLGYARVHLANCKHCRGGLGQEGQHKTGSGATEWLGPFASKQDAIAQMNALKPKNGNLCGHCRP